jgi:Fungal specific transcription factor domain
VCKDLVVYNDPTQNPFQDLIPASNKHEILLQLIIAISALHVSNAAQKQLIYDTMRRLRSRGSTQGAASSSLSSIRWAEPYRHALTAKQRALHLFNTALNVFTLADLDVTLAAVLLFIQLELVDSGKDSWKWHINGVSKLIDVLGGWNGLAHPTSTPLRRCLISNCLVYAAFHFLRSFKIPLICFVTALPPLVRRCRALRCPA